jgi:hypothetical protein
MYWLNEFVREVEVMLKVNCGRQDCGGSEMRMTERNGVEIDYCDVCRGIWLDRGELDKIIERADQGSSPRRENDGYEQRSPQYQPSPLQSQKRYDDDDDRDEYYRRERDKRNDDDRRERYDRDDDSRREQYYERDGEYRGDKKKRKSSWLGELFDF